MSIVSPPGYGRPDYSAPSPNLSTLVAYIDQAITTQYLTPVVSTLAWQGVEVLWVPSQISSFVDIQWWDSAAQNNLIDDTVICSVDGNQVIGPYTFPNIGPYLQVKVEHYPNQVIGRKEQLWVFLTGRTPIYPSAYLTDNVVADANDTVPANGTLNVTTNNSWVGAAKLYLTSTEAVSWEMQVANILGNFVGIDGSSAAATAFSVPIVCPASEWRIVLTNSGATNATINLYITPSATGAT